MISLSVLWENNEQFCKQWIENNLHRKENEQFLNNVEQKIILCKILEIVYTENSEQFSWENSEQFYLMPKIVLLSQQFYIQLIRTFYKFKIFEAFTIRWFIQIIHFSFMEFVHYSYGYIFKKINTKTI